MDYSSVMEAIERKTSVNVNPKDIVKVYSGADYFVFAVQAAEMTILCKVLPDGKYEVKINVW